MDKLLVSFSSFIFDEAEGIKKSLIMSPKTVVPISNQATTKFIKEISGKSESLNKHFSKSLVPLEGLVGRTTYKKWQSSFQNYFDPRQNIAIGVVPGYDTPENIFQRSTPFLKSIFPVYSWCYSASVYTDHRIPSLSNAIEIKKIGETAKIDDDSKANFDFFNMLDEIIFYNVGNLSWDQIADLRESKHYNDFIKAIIKLKEYEFKKPGGAYFTILNDLFQFVGETESNLTKSIFKAFYTNIPIPPVNPLAVAESLKDIHKTKEISDKYGHLFFINEIRNKASSTES